MNARMEIRLAASTLAALTLGGGCAAPNGLNHIDAVPAQSYGGARPARSLPRLALPAVAQRIRRRSKISPATKGRLLYVADPFAGAVFVYTYPQLSGAGELTGFGSVDGVCTDRQGYVWVLDTSDVAAWEFAHGSFEPINYVQPGDSSGNPGVGDGCSVDPKSGDLAVAGVGPGITVFRNGQETHATYWDFSFFQFSFIGYDGAGNVFADGLLQSSFAFGLDELVKGTSALTDVTLSGGSISRPGGIQWDGKNLDIADSSSGNIYQTNGSAILNTIGTSAGCQGQFYIPANHRRIIVPDPCNAQTEIYAYPAGGSPIKIVSGGQSSPSGVAISAPR